MVDRSVVLCKIVKDGIGVYCLWVIEVVVCMSEWFGSNIIRMSSTYLQ